MSHNILARRPEDLNVGWAQRVINKHNSHAIVSNVNIVSVDVGTTTRIRLAIKHDGPAALPRQWFVKLPSLTLRARMITALPRLLHTEVRFYNEAAQAIPIAIPDLLAAQSIPGGGSTLVLKDVTESGAIAGHTGEALTATQATLVIEQLARIHAHFWGKADLMKTYHWLAAPVRSLEDGLGTALAVPLMIRGLDQAGKLIPPGLDVLAVRYARNRHQVMRFLSDAPQTLIHHDCHPGNLFWSQSQPGLLDWQLVRFGEGIGDVAYFLATALTPEVRRAQETKLLSVYAERLKENGIMGINNDNLLQRYRAHLIYPFEAMVISLAVGGMIQLEKNYELIRRTVAAVEDLDVFSAIPIRRGNFQKL